MTKESIVGMDIVGKEPRSEQGSYFQNNFWWWRPLADYCGKVAPEITRECRHWHTNDGDGLDDTGSKSLANVLQAEIDSGRAASFERLRNSEMEMLPNEPCKICASTGIELPVSSDGAGNHDGGVSCYSCDGAGYKPPRAAGYYFDVATGSADY
jgi:hypothetical protein